MIFIQDAEQKTSDAQLRGQLEFLNQQIEDYKVRYPVNSTSSFLNVGAQVPQ